MKQHHAKDHRKDQAGIAKRGDGGDIACAHCRGQGGVAEGGENGGGEQGGQGGEFGEVQR